MSVPSKTIHPRVALFAIDVGELISFRYVLLMLIVRDIKLRYKQTLLGFLWVVLQPLLTALLFVWIFDKGLSLPHQGTSYLTFAFSALIPWMVFSQSLQRAGPSIVNDSRLITKVYFPRLFIPLAATLGVAVDYLIATLLGFGFASYEGRWLQRALLWLPLATLHLFCFCCGWNLLIAALTVYFRDFKHATAFLLQLWMFASPIVYPMSVIPKSYLWLYQCNPLVGIIELFRFIFIGGEFPISSIAVSGGMTLFLLGLALVIFRKMEHNFADVI